MTNKDPFHAPTSGLPLSFRKWWFTVVHPVVKTSFSRNLGPLFAPVVSCFLFPTLSSLVSVLFLLEEEEDLHLCVNRILKWNKSHFI